MGDHLPPPSNWTGTVQSGGRPSVEGRALVWRPVLLPQDRTLTVPDTGRMSGVQRRRLPRVLVPPVPRGAGQADPTAPPLPCPNGNMSPNVQYDSPGTGGGPEDRHCGGLVGGRQRRPDDDNDWGLRAPQQFKLFGAQKAPRSARLHYTDVEWGELQQQQQQGPMGRCQWSLLKAECVDGGHGGL